MLLIVKPYGDGFHQACHGLHQAYQLLMTLQEQQDVTEQAQACPSLHSIRKDKKRNETLKKSSGNPHCNGFTWADQE